MLILTGGSVCNGLFWCIVLSQCLLFSPTSAKMYVGAAVNATALHQPEYARLVRRLYEFVTPGNEMKWGSVQKDQNHQDVYDFKAADEIVGFAKAYKKKIHGHPLLWQRQLPPWVEKFGKDDLRKATNNHINTVIKYFNTNLTAIDVGNELIGDDASLRKNIWLNNIGEGYIVEFFKAARDAAKQCNPELKLFVNDYSIEGRNAKSDKLYALAKDLKAQGLLDAVGFQSHLIVGQVPKDMFENLKRFVDLGLQVAITELDIRIKVQGVSPEDIKKSLDQQAQDYAAVFQICHDLPGCVGVTVWGVSDAMSWVNDEFPGFGKPLLHDENYRAKAAFQSVQRYFGPGT